MTNRKEHWEKVYVEKKPTEVSWYQEKPRMSVELIRWAMARQGNKGAEELPAASASERVRSAPGDEQVRGTRSRGDDTMRAHRNSSNGIIDVGGGTSVLVDCLLDDGFKDVTVLDVSGGALRAARERLGARAKQVDWIESDVTTFEPARTWRIWHDRAVFHFLTEESDRRAYVRALKRALAPGGCAIISTFGPDGPQMCSGLNVRRNDPRGVLKELGEDEFELLRSEEEAHVTPWGKAQMFVYGVFGRRNRI